MALMAQGIVGGEMAWPLVIVGIFTLLIRREVRRCGASGTEGTPVPQSSGDARCGIIQASDTEPPSDPETTRRPPS